MKISGHPFCSLGGKETFSAFFTKVGMGRKRHLQSLVDTPERPLGKDAANGSSEPIPTVFGSAANGSYSMVQALTRGPNG